MPRYTTVNIYVKDYYRLGVDEPLSTSVKRFVHEEFLAILSGDREEYHQKMGKIHTTLSLDDQCMEEIVFIREFYGFSKLGDVVRIAIKNGLKSGASGEG